MLQSPSTQQTSFPSLPPDPDDIDIIGYERLKVPLKHDMKERMTKLENKLQKTDTELQKTDTELQKINTRVTDLQNRVKALTLASEGYRKVRHRFLEVYHRDIRNDVDGQGLKKINQGNEAAYYGDAVTDVSLYTSHERNDEIVMTELYGLSVFQISCLARTDTFKSISTINAGATWRAKGPSNIPADVDAAFKTFLEELKENLDGNPTDGATSLSKAYCAFWAAHKRHK